MVITLDVPTLPFDVNQYYEEFLNFLSTGNVYGQSRISIPATKPAIGPSVVSAVEQVDVLSQLSPGLYYYVVEATIQIPDISGIITKETLTSREVSVGVAPGHSVAINWLAYTDAVSYNIYRTQDPGNYRNNLIATVLAPTVTFVDNGFQTQLGIPLGQKIILTGTFSVPGVYDAKLFISSKNSDFGLFEEQTTNVDGSFRFEISVPYGSNQFYVTDGSNNSNIIYINANNLFAFFDMMANDLKTYWQELIERVKAGPHLFDVQDMFDGNTRLSQISDFVKFWQVMTSVIRPQDYTDSQLRALVIAVIDAYRNATSYAALKNVILQILPMWLDTSFIPLDIYNTGFSLGKGSTTKILGKFKAVRVGINPTLEYSWNDGTGAVPYVVGNIRGYIAGGTNTIGSSPGILRWEIIYLDGTLDGNGYFNLNVLETLTNPNFDQQTLPDGAVVLAIVQIDNDDIVWISGQSYIATTSAQFMGVGTGPYLVGPSFIADRARLNSRGYKYSRIAIYLTTLNPVGVNYDTYVTMLTRLLEELKPAKMTIILGYPPNDTYTEIYNNQ